MDTQLTVELPGPLLLATDGSTITLTWSDGSILQSTASLSESFEDVLDATSPFTIDPQSGADKQFYRLRW